MSCSLSCTSKPGITRAPKDASKMIFKIPKIFKTPKIKMPKWLKLPGKAKLTGHQVPVTPVGTIKGQQISERATLPAWLQALLTPNLDTA